MKRLLIHYQLQSQNTTFPTMFRDMNNYMYHFLGSVSIRTLFHKAKTTNYVMEKCNRKEKNCFAWIWHLDGHGFIGIEI